MKNSGHADEKSHPTRVKAIAAVSGGLDSTLAAALISRLGIDVVLLYVKHLFSGGERKEAALKEFANRLGLPLRIVDATIEHLDVIRYPKHGYGRGMNPCLDCRIFLLRIAKRVMEEEGAQFVITGEVLNQRPMSQHRSALDVVAEESGLSDRLLRPLCANLLPETLPVRMGWISRDDLYSFSGRSRREQVALAERLGITGYQQPAGGCLLTERVYAARLRDAFEHSDKKGMGIDQFRLLRFGRHFRLSERTKAIVGRNEGENEVLSGFSQGRILIEPIDLMGPTTLVEGEPTEEEILLAAALTARYADSEPGRPARFRVSADGSEREVSVIPLERDDPRIPSWRIG